MTNNNNNILTSKDYLEFVAKAHRINFERDPKPCQYMGPVDMLLREGKEFQTGPNTFLGYGLTKQCYRNALELAILKPDLYTYVEGYAINLLPVLHAWCIDKDGVVVEPTPNWEKGYSYFGIPFQTSYAKKMILHMGTGCVDSWEVGYPLCSGAHKPEEAFAVFSR